MRLLFMYVRYSLMFASENTALLPLSHLILFANHILSFHDLVHSNRVSNFYLNPITAASVMT